MRDSRGARRWADSGGRWVVGGGEIGVNCFLGKGFAAPDYERVIGEGAGMRLAPEVDPDSS